MSFYDTNGNPNEVVDDVFGNSDDSDDLDMRDISAATKSRVQRDIVVQDENRFKMSTYPSSVIESTNLLRLPGAFGIQEKPFDGKKYSEQEELTELSEKRRISRAEALIRWRWRRDSDGNLIRDGRGKPIRESNTRIVKWSNGSYQLLIGEDNIIDLQILDNIENNQYISTLQKIQNRDTDTEEDVLCIESHLKSRLNFSPLHLAPISDSIVDSAKSLDYLMNAPTKGPSKRSQDNRRRNHAIKDKEMDRDFLVGGDDEMNLSNIKEKGRSGRFYETANYTDDMSLGTGDD